jgi:hypothetical protein
MPAPIDILLDPWPNLALHSAIFIGALIIMILWINGTVEHPWAPTIVMFGFALFNLLLSIRNKIINSDDNGGNGGNNGGDNGDDDDKTGGHEVSGGRTITNKQPSTPSSESTKTSHTHDPNDEPGAKHAIPSIKGSGLYDVEPMGTYHPDPHTSNNINDIVKSKPDINGRN